MTLAAPTVTTMCHSVDERIVWSVRIQPVWPLGRPGSRTCTQRLPSLPLTKPITGSTVRTLVSGRWAATGSTTRACRSADGVRDVVLQQDHERLRHGDPRRLRLSGSGERDGRRECDGDEGQPPHPVNCEGPAVGESTASAQAR